jgi:hypothetical protein
MPMSVATPDWLAKRGGELRPHVLGGSMVVFDHQPQYLLAPLPVAGKFGCGVTQTINGRRLDGKEIFPTADDAIRGGLEELRKALGW